jgi:hypothetical protein
MRGQYRPTQTANASAKCQRHRQKTYRIGGSVSKTTFPLTSSATAVAFAPERAPDSFDVTSVPGPSESVKVHLFPSPATTAPALLTTREEPMPCRKTQ